VPLSLYTVNTRRVELEPPTMNSIAGQNNPPKSANTYTAFGPHPSGCM
jgi:hypothetical protein